MESVQASVSDEISRSGTGSGSDNEGFEKSGISDIQKSNDLGENICHDLDLYLEDINDRFTISRMVSNAIIKGIVNAVSQEAAEIVAVKQLEVASMKEQVLRLQQRGNTEVNTLTNHVDVHRHGHRAESLGLPSPTVNEQLERLGQCIGNAKQFSGNAEESILIMNDLDEAFNCLKSLLIDTSQQVDTTTFSPESSVEDWKVELYICKELETMVFCTILQGLQAEYAKQLWNVCNVLAFTDRFDEIASLRHELHSIHKLFDCPEVGNLSPQGSMEMDQLHRKVFANHSHIWNTCEEFKYIIYENFETSPLKHMKAAELYQHFKTLFTNLKRVHESAVQQMTEEYFSLKRDYLKERESSKERGAFATFRKDKDFETVKTKMTEAIVKLDEIVKDNENLSEFCNYSRDTLNCLLSENFRLKDLLNRQHLETFHLSSQASEATKKLLQHSWAEENLNKLVRDLKCTLRDGHIEASITEEIYKCIIREMGKLINSSSEDLNLISVIMQDIYGALYGEIYHAGVVKKSDNEDSDLRSTIEQQIYCTVFQQVLGDLSMNINGWMENCLKKDELLGFLQCKVSEIEIELGEKGKENEELKLQVLLLKDIIKEKIKVSVDITALYEKERTQFIEELNKLRDQEVHKSNELVLLKHKLEDSEKQIEKLKSELKLSQDKLRKSDEEMTNFTSILNQNYLASIREKDNEHVKHMKSLSHVIHGMLNSFADFELQIGKKMGWQSVRLDNSTSQLHSFIPKVNVLRRTSSLYKERLEKRCSDLQKAEAEVDLLGDEVDALLSLLEKIYVALDHYSPILQHYPGVIEILKLVKRELSRDSVKCHLTAT